jgi:hypothetical protein
MNITYSDISKRIRFRDKKIMGSAITPRLYTEHNVFCTDNAINAINNWETLAESSNEAFNKALDIFEEVCINENQSNINTCLSYLIENVDKVRDAGQLLNSLKHRSARLKRKSATKVKSAHNKVTDNIQDAINRVSNSLSVKGVATTTSTINRDEATQESFNELIEQCKRVKECDRIIENYSKISKRYNIDKIISESNDMYLAIMEITKCIDTYAIPFKNKYSHALEASYYAINKYNMNYPSSNIIEAVTDYFIFSYPVSETDISAIKEVRDISVVFEQNDFDSISYLIEDAIENIEEGYSNVKELIEEYCSPMNEFNIKKPIVNKAKEVKTATKSLIKNAKKGNPDERVSKQIQKEIDIFRKECAKDPDNKNNVIRLKALVTSIFAKDPYQIVNELPKFFSIIRGFFIIVGITIHPIIGLVAFITDRILAMTFSRKQTEKIVKAYQNEIDAAKNKLEKTKDDTAKNNIKKYIEELNKDYSKIKEYENDLYSEDENYDRDTSTEYNKDSEDDDFDFDDWDDFDFEEAASIVYISDIMESISEGLIDDNVEGIIFNNLYKLDNDSIDSLSDFSITVPIILEKDKLCEALTIYRNTLREDSKVYNCMRIDCLNENIYKLKENTNVYATSNNLSGIRCYLACLNEMVNMNSSTEYIMELNFSNTLKLAVDRLKKTALKLKDKDKQISNNIDVAVNNVSKSMETAMMNDNREAVIKGKLLPSASKCIKIACALGVAWAINPAVAVIGAIGAFACSRKLKAKERQLVLDDIEIELKMCERYIREAEEKGELKKVRQLEIIQRNLQRQQQRIKYNMRVIYNQNVPNVATND